MPFPLPPPITSRYATLAIHGSDTFRLLQFPSNLVVSLGDTIRASWPPGIQSERVYNGAYDYKVKGRPFGMLGVKEAVGGMRLVRHVFAVLWSEGWRVALTVGHSQHRGAKDTIVFRKRGTEGGQVDGVGKEVGPKVEWLVLAPSRGDRVRVIYDKPSWRARTASGHSGEITDDDDEGVSGVAGSSVPPDHDHHDLSMLIQTLTKAIGDVDYFQSGKWDHDSFEFKLKGYPWAAIGGNTVKVRRLLIVLVETLERFGWRSYATIRQRTESDDVKKADSWYFVREEGWVAGSPFNDDGEGLAL